jgi:hypothetical protein
LIALGEQPVIQRPRVLELCRERVHRRQPVVRDQGADTSRFGQMGGDFPVAVLRAADEATAVEIDQHPLSVATQRVRPDRGQAGRGDLLVGDVGRLFGKGVEPVGATQVDLRIDGHDRCRGRGHSFGRARRERLAQLEPFLARHVLVSLSVHRPKLVG